MSFIQQSIAKKYINYFLIGYAFCLPVSKAGVNLFEFLILFLWLFSDDWKERFSKYKSNLLIVSISALILFSILSLVFWGCSDLSNALKYIAKYKHFLMIFAIYTFFDIKYVKYVFSAFLLGMFVSEIVSYGIFFEWWHYKKVLPSDPSPFMSRTDYSVYLSFTSIILLMDIIYTKKLFSRLIYFLFFLSVTTNLFLNGGRTGQVVFVAVIFLSIILSFKNKIKAFGVSLFILASVFFLAYNFSPNFKYRLDYSVSEIGDMIEKNDFRGGFSTRVSLWVCGIDKFTNNPLVGAGIGNEMKDIRYYAKKNHFDPQFLYGFSKSDHHNTFITMAVQQGITGLIILVFIFYSIVTLKFKTYRYKILNYTFILAFFMWSMGGITFHTMNPMVFFALFAGLFNKISQIENT